MDRITNTDKWKDDWFLSLDAPSKLIFIYLYENCDDAGFINLNSVFISQQLGITPKLVVKSIMKIHKAIIFDSSDAKAGKKIWIKNYLFYQNHLPLSESNSVHKKIILIIKKNLPLFNHNPELLNLLSIKEDKPEPETPVVKKKRATPSKFNKPTLDDFKEYGFREAYEKGVKITEDFIEGLYDHYESNGWKVGGKTPMKDWQSAVRNAIRREKKEPFKSNTTKTPSTKLDKLTGANSNYQDVNVQ